MAVMSGFHSDTYISDQSLGDSLFPLVTQLEPLSMPSFKTNTSASTNSSPEASLTELSGSSECDFREIAEVHSGSQSPPLITILCDQHFNLPPSSTPLVPAEMNNEFDDHVYSRRAIDEEDEEDEKLASTGKVAANQEGLLLPPPRALIDHPTFIPEEQKVLYREATFILEVCQWIVVIVYNCLIRCKQGLWVPIGLSSREVLEIAKLYGEARLRHIQRDFQLAQARLREQEMRMLSFKEGYNVAHQRFKKAFHNYQVLLKSSTLQISVGVPTSFIKTVLDNDSYSEQRVIFCMSIKLAAIYYYSLCTITLP